MRLILSLALIACHLAIALPLPSECQLILDGVVEELGRATGNLRVVHDDPRDVELGIFAMRLSRPYELSPTDRVTPTAIPRSLASYPRQGLLSLITDLEEEGGGVYAIRGISSWGAFGFDDGNRPLTALVADRDLSTAKAASILRHEQAHFELWRVWRDIFVGEGYDRATALKMAREILASPFGVLFSESAATREELRTPGTVDTPFKEVGSIVHRANYPPLKALLQALELRRQLNGKESRRGPAARARLEENIEYFRQMIWDRTERVRTAVGRYHARRFGNTMTLGQARSVAMQWIEAGGKAPFESLPEPVQDYLHAVRLQSAPQCLEDYFGVRSWPLHTRAEVQALLLPN